MPQINRIFLDTNALRQTWPRLSVKVQNIFTAARKLSVAIELPDPVVIELDRHWREHTENERRNTEQSLRNFGSLVGAETLHDCIPEWDVIVNGYKAMCDRLRGNWKIAITPMPTVSLNDIFHQATERELVFGEKGVNFQDAIIFHSIVERLATIPDQHGAFITADGVFWKEQEKLQKYLRQRRVSLDFLKLPEAEEQLTKRLGAAEVARYEHHKMLAKAAMNAFLPELGHTLDKRHDPPLMEEVALRNFHLDEVVDVDVPVLDEELAPGSKRKLSAIIRGTVEEVVGESNPLMRSFQVKVFEIGITAEGVFDGQAYRDLKLLTYLYGSPGYLNTVITPKKAVAGPLA